MTTAKLFISGFFSMLFLSLAVILLGGAGIVLSAGYLLLSIAGISFSVGWEIDSLDKKYEIKDKTKKLLNEAFPELTIENMINKEVNKNKHNIDNLIGASVMHGSGFFGF